MIRSEGWGPAKTDLAGLPFSCGEEEGVGVAEIGEWMKTVKALWESCPNASSGALLSWQVVCKCETNFFSSDPPHHQTLADSVAVQATQRRVTVCAPLSSTLPARASIRTSVRLNFLASGGAPLDFTSPRCSRGPPASLQPPRRETPWPATIWSTRPPPTTRSTMRRRSASASAASGKYLASDHNHESHLTSY